MNFEVEERVNYPREVVFTTIRDKLPELVPYLPNVKKIDVLEKKKTKDIVNLKNKWYADFEIPRAVQKVIKIEEIAWIDYARWSEKDYTCEWRIEPVFFKEYVDVKGVNYYYEDDGETIIKLTGEINIDVSKHPLVPRLLSGVINKEITGIVVNGIKPNLVSLIEGVRKFLKSKKK